MDLGNKKLNNLISKDFNLQKEAAAFIINNKDIKAFKILSEKADFLFDFIKDKISKNLMLAVNKDNVLNLFEFMKLYSDDFKNFIINSFIKFKTPAIEEKLIKSLQNGSDEEKTYALEFYFKVNPEKILDFAKENIFSDFLPLKNISIKLLAKNNERKELNRAIEVLKSNEDDYEKLRAAEFLSIYGDKSAFYPVFNYLKEAGANEIIASNLLLIKSFKELMEENLEDEILTIYSSIVYNFPENISFEDIAFYNDEGIFNYLIESDNNFSILLILFLRKRLKEALSDEAYSIDFSGNIKNEAKNFLSSLNLISENISAKEVIEQSLLGKSKTEVIMALELTDKNQEAEIKNILNNTDDNEITLSCISKLKELSLLQNSDIDKIKENIKNETVKLELESFYS